MFPLLLAFPLQSDSCEFPHKKIFHSPAHPSKHIFRRPSLSLFQPTGRHTGDLSFRNLHSTRILCICDIVSCPDFGHIEIVSGGEGLSPVELPSSNGDVPTPPLIVEVYRRSLFGIVSQIHVCRPISVSAVIFIRRMHLQAKYYFYHPNSRQMTASLLSLTI